MKMVIYYIGETVNFTIFLTYRLNRKKTRMICSSIVLSKITMSVFDKILCKPQQVVRVCRHTVVKQARD